MYGHTLVGGGGQTHFTGREKHTLVGKEHTVVGRLHNIWMIPYELFTVLEIDMLKYLQNKYKSAP